MRSAVLLVVLLCASEVWTQNTMKLCGRELVRAVVYTCGGSRWRRLMETTDFGSTAPSFMGSRSLDTRRELPQRDLNRDLTIMCCLIGCRNSDLSRLC